jgi:hypothetical protein
MPAGPDKKYEVLHDFSYDWLTYNQDLKVFTPYFEDNSREKKSVSLKINLDDYPGAFLLIKSSENNSFLFLNNILKKQLKSNSWTLYPIKELRKISGRSEILLSIYGNTSPKDLEVFVGYPGKIQTESTRSENEEGLFNLSPRSDDPFRSSLVIIFIFNVLIMSFLVSNYNKAYKKYFNLYDLTSPAPKENSFLVNKPLDRPNMFFLIFLSILSGFLVILIQNDKVLDISDSFFFQNGATFGIIILNFFKVSLLIFIAFVVKYFYILLTGKLFNIEKIVDIHFFKILQSTIYFFTFFVIFILVLQNTFLGKAFEFKSLVSFLFTVFYILRTILVYVTINQKGNIKTLYLISYLCIVEVFPIIIGLRIFL